MVLSYRECTMELFELRTRPFPSFTAHRLTGRSAIDKAFGTSDVPNSKKTNKQANGRYDIFALLILIRRVTMYREIY